MVTAGRRRQLLLDSVRPAPGTKVRPRYLTVRGHTVRLADAPRIVNACYLAGILKRLS